MTSLTSPYTILITGGTRGIGLELTRQACLEPHRIATIPENQPYHVFVTHRSDSNLSELDKLQAEIISSQQSHVTLRMLELDLACIESIKAFTLHLKTLTTRLDLAIFNAGVLLEPPGTTLETEIDIEMYNKSHFINAIAPQMVFHGIQDLLHETIKTAYGGVVLDKTQYVDRLSLLPDLTTAPLSNPEITPLDTKTSVRVLFIGSGWGSIGNNASRTTSPIYCSSKAAAHALTKCLSHTYPSIAFISIHPGHVRTDMGGAIGIPAVESINGIYKTYSEKCFVTTSMQELHTYEGKVLPW